MAISELQGDYVVLDLAPFLKVIRSKSHLDSLGLEQLEPVGVVERLEVRAQVVTPLEVDGAKVAPEGRLTSVSPLVHRQVAPPLEHPGNEKDIIV